jgi:lysophospholipase L1-like esterase
VTTIDGIVLPRRNTAAGAATSNPVLFVGERGFETDTGKWKTGDGSTHWNDLPYGPAWSDPAMVAAAWAETTDKQAAAVRPALVAIGDSFTAKSYASTVWNGASYSRISSWYADSYLTAALVWNRQPCTVIPTGVTSQQANAGLARFDTDVTPLRPHVVLEEYGSNDMVSSRTAAATFADRLAMWGKAWKFGAKVIATTCPPRDGFTTAQMKEALKLNSMLRNFAATNPQDFALVDLWSALADPATGLFKSGYSTDGTHPNTLGCWAAGQAFEAAFDRFFPAAATGLALVNVNDDNFLVNPLMVTAGGVIASNKGLTGGVAQSWVGTSGGTDANLTAVMSLVARADGLGYWQQITTTVIPDSSTTVALFQDCGTGTIAVGDILQALVEFETDAGGWTNGKLDLTLTCMSADSLTAYSHTGSFNPGADSIINVRPEAGVLRTPPIVVPTGTTHLFLNAVVGGLGTVRFGRPAIRKLAA